MIPRHSADYDLLGFNLDNPSRIPPDDAIQALAVVEANCRPCNHDSALKLLGVMRFLTVSRADDDDDLPARFAIWARIIADENIPADVVAAAQYSWCDRERFWPSWAEFSAETGRHWPLRRDLRLLLPHLLDQNDGAGEPAASGGSA